MPLVRQSPPATTPVTPDALAEHLRLPHAAPETEQTVELTALIRAATAMIERRLDTALVAQDWLWRTSSPARSLPLSPVIAITSVEVVASGGIRTPLANWSLVRDRPRPRLAVTVHPPVPRNGHVEVLFTAGYGPTADDVPDDIRHAVTLLAAHFYENREATTEGRDPLPLGVASLLAPYRPIRIS